MILITSLLMFYIFRALARSYSNNNRVATGIGRFFEPIVIYIRDDIAIPNIGAIHAIFVNSLFLHMVFNIFWFNPLGVNVTGNIAVTFALALLTFLITNLTGTKDLLETHF